MNPFNEVIKETVIEDVKDLPSPMTPKDIYSYYNREKHTIGWGKTYEIAKKIGRKIGPGNKIYINKADFIKFLYNMK